VYCGRFPREKKSTVLHKTPFTKHLKNTAKHRKTENSHKTRFVKLRRKTPQKKQNGLTRPVRGVLWCFAVSAVFYVFCGCFSKNIVVRCFAVFCVLWRFAFCVLRCFVCVFLAFFTKQHKTDQNIYKTNKTNKIRFVQYSAIRCCASLSHSENVYKKHSQNTSKILQNSLKTSAKHRKTLVFKKHSQNTTKHPQNTRKTPQNTAKHHKTHLLTIKQTELANKPLRSRVTLCLCKDPWLILIEKKREALRRPPMHGGSLNVWVDPTVAVARYACYYTTTILLLLLLQRHDYHYYYYTYHFYYQVTKLLLYMYANIRRHQHQHTRVRANRPAAPGQSSGVVAETPHPTPYPQADTPHDRPP